MYQPWQTDTSMEAVMELIEERERREVGHSFSHRHNNYDSHHSESGNWGIMSLNDMNAPTRPPNQHSFTGYGRGELEGSRRREMSWSPGRRDGRELPPVAQWGLEIASRLSEHMRAGRAPSSSSDGERRASRPELRQDTSETRTSTNERKRCSSRSDAEARKRGRRSNSRSKYGVSGSRDSTRCRSRSRDKTRGRSSSRDRKQNSSGRKDERSNSRDWKRHSRGSGYNKLHSSSRDKRRDRSSSTERNTRSLSRDERDLSSACESPVQSSATIQPKQTATPAAVADATSDILSKFISIIKDVKEQPQSKIIPRNDVIPEFDPLDKANAIDTWITRVDDIAKLFGWEQSETLQYAMPKLTGLARAWYLGRKDFIHSWAEWKKKLVEQFPCPDYWQMLDELKQRQCSDDEALENYFHDKMTLVKRCGIRGRQAVQCVLQGVRDEPVRLFAAAAQLDEPEDLLTFLQTAETIRKKVSAVATPAVATTTPASTAGSKNNGKPQCSICLKFGHLETNCFKAKPAAMKAIQCKTCNKYGHKSTVCWYKLKTNKIPAKSSKKIKANKINSQKQCFSCGLIGHKESACQIAWHKIAEGTAKKKCFCCNEVGHLNNACPRREENQTPARAAATAPGPGGADVSNDEPPPPGVEEH